MARKPNWELIVQQSERITPNMQRITFGGAGLSGFPEDIASAYLKVSFPSKGSAADRLPDRESAAVRSYTVRSYDSSTGELEMDFVVHHDAGPASAWAEQASPGDKLSAGGPGPKKLLTLAGDWYLVVGDMSALPAIGANLAHLPQDAIGYALIEILDDADRQDLAVPANLDVIWLVNPDPTRSVEVVTSAVRSLRWLDGQCEAWVAGELNTVRAIRTWLKNECGMSRKHMYASSYWQLGRSDEQHRVEKQKDQDS